MELHAAQFGTIDGSYQLAFTGIYRTIEIQSNGTGTWDIIGAYYA